MDTTITLLPQASAPVAPAATLRFDRVEDSRCPPDVRCITAGKLSYHFTLSAAAGAESFALDQQASAYASAKAPGVTIALAPAAAAPPPPRPSTAAGPAPAIAVTLNITLNMTRQP